MSQLVPLFFGFTAADVDAGNQSRMNGGLPVDTLGESQGFARITSRGIDVIEGNATSPFAINIVHSSSNVQIGEGNAQSFTFSGEKIVGAINNSNATTTEQEKAKSLWQSVLDRLTKVIGLFTGA